MNFTFSERIAEIPHSYYCAKYPPLRKSEKRVLIFPLLTFETEIIQS